MERGFGVRSGVNKQSWEESDFPILCETCLGENPYVRMLKSPAAKECKICARPFTNFRWKAGPKGRYKNTEVCQTCAKLKNVCQTCLLDLTYHLPVEVRDKFLGEKKIALPTQEANRNFLMDQVNKNIDNLALPYQELENNKVLEELARNRAKPYYKRNLPQICSFFVKGTCNRGEECPYRHELPSEDGNLSSQNTIDRYHGRNDPVANKILGNVYENQRVKPPADTTISTLFIRDLPADITEEDLIGIFKSFGDVDHVKILPGGKSGLISFAERSSCENAIKDLYGKLVIKSQAVQVMWARPEKAPEVTEAPKDSSLLIPHHVPSLIQASVSKNPLIKPPSLPPPDADMSMVNQNKFIENIANIGNATYYPSMDPNSLGGMRTDKTRYVGK